MNYPEITRAFIATMHEDAHLNLCERDEPFNTLVIPEADKAIISEYIEALLKHIAYDGLDLPEVGSQLYIGLLYDPLDSIVDGVDLQDCHEVHASVDDAGAGYIGFSFGLAGVQYSGGSL